MGMNLTTTKSRKNDKFMDCLKCGERVKCIDGIYFDSETSERHYCRNSSPVEIIDINEVPNEADEYAKRATKELKTRDANIKKRQLREKAIAAQKKEESKTFNSIRPVDRYAKYRVPEKVKKSPERFTCRYCKNENVYLIKSRKYEKVGTMYIAHKCKVSTRMSHK